MKMLCSFNTKCLGVFVKKFLDLLVFIFRADKTFPFYRIKVLISFAQSVQIVSTTELMSDLIFVVGDWGGVVAKAPRY